MPIVLEAGLAMQLERDGKYASFRKRNSYEDPKEEQYLEQERLRFKMSKIKHKMAVISGKGGARGLSGDEQEKEWEAAEKSC